VYKALFLFTLISTTHILPSTAQPEVDTKNNLQTFHFPITDRERKIQHATCTADKNVKAPEGWRLFAHEIGRLIGLAKPVVPYQCHCRNCEGDILIHDWCNAKDAHESNVCLRKIGAFVVQGFVASTYGADYSTIISEQRVISELRGRVKDIDPHTMTKFLQLPPRYQEAIRDVLVAEFEMLPVTNNGNELMNRFMVGFYLKQVPWSFPKELQSLVTEYVGPHAISLTKLLRPTKFDHLSLFRVKEAPRALAYYLWADTVSSNCTIRHINSIEGLHKICFIKRPDALTIDCSHNEITEIPHLGNHNCLDRKILDHLVALNLSHNFITRVPSCLIDPRFLHDELSSLQVIDLSHNLISAFDNDFYLYLMQLPERLTIKLSGNPLTENTRKKLAQFRNVRTQ